MRISVIIPARYDSSRFPGKPLVDINGMSMVMRVYRQALKASGISDVIVATDDHRILDHVNDCGGKAIMTGSNHESGTSRCAEVAEILHKQGNAFDAFINVQGDEPFIHPAQIEHVADLLQQQGGGIATLVKKISASGELFGRDTVKALLASTGRVMYFSRQPIPFVRDADPDEWLQKTDFYKHIGIYGYHNETLCNIARLLPAPPEQAEKLEQLRWLYHGYTIVAGVTGYESLAVDTPGDLLKLINNPDFSDRSL